MASQFTIPSISPVALSHSQSPCWITNTVSKDDLLAFHVRTYGKHFAGTIPDLSTASASFTTYDMDIVPDDDELGYYQDGVKRTLTDAQIAMFRHSEIQAVLRERRHAQEKDMSDFLTVARSQELQDGAWGLQEVDKDQDVVDDDIDDKNIKDQKLEDEGEIEDDDEEEYAQFLEAERREMELVASSRRSKPGKNQESKAGRASTRRIVRELDEIPNAMDALDYGE